MAGNRIVAVTSPALPGGSSVVEITQNTQRAAVQSRSFASVAPVYFLAGRGIGLTPTCSSAVYGAP